MNELMRRLSERVPREPGLHVEENLLREFRAHHKRQARSWIYFLPAAALLALIFVLLLRPARQPRFEVQSTPEIDPAALQGFLPLPYAQSGVPLGEGMVLRVQLRAADLAVLGVATPPVSARQRIGADLLIGQDGMARAVRFVP